MIAVRNCNEYSTPSTPLVLVASISHNSQPQFFSQRPGDVRKHGRLPGLRSEHNEGFWRTQLGQRGLADVVHPHCPAADVSRCYGDGIINP